MPRCSTACDFVAVSPGLAPLRRAAPSSRRPPPNRTSPSGARSRLFAAGAGSAARTQQGYAPKVLAITGTNGKTTVTALTGLLVERAGKTRGRGRQHRPDAARHARREDRRRRAARGLGARAVELPAATRPSASSRRRHRAERDAGPPRLARRHGRLRRRQGAHLRRGHGAVLLNRDDAAGRCSMLPDADRARASAGQHATRSTFGGDCRSAPATTASSACNGMAWLVRALEAERRTEEAPEERRGRSRSSASSSA